MKSAPISKLAQHPVVSRERWLPARQKLLREEKAFTRRRDRLSARRRALPWVRVDQPYVFAAPRRKLSLAELFGGRNQLIVYHFMLGPGWEEGCPSCSYVVDHVDGMLPHLAARDTAFVAVSHAPLPEIIRFKKRMGWKFDWVSSHGSAFNFDYSVSFDPREIKRRQVFYNYRLTKVPVEELPGLSVFARDTQGAVFHTYSTYSRGLDLLVGTYNYLDLVPKGRDEHAEHTMNWVRHHDRYPHAAAAR